MLERWIVGVLLASVLLCGPPAAWGQSVDYDTDNDGLSEITSLA